MIGHEFQIYDDVNGQPSSEPSKYLCRTEYNPGANPGNPAWNGIFTSAGTLDSGGDSSTLAAIKAWNNANPGNQVPECAIAYPQVNAGGQTGRWKVENLPEKDKDLNTGNGPTTGNYWLVETKAPDKQISLNGSQMRPVQGVQLLAQPVPFRIWPLEPGPPIDGSTQSMRGHGQLDVAESGSYGQFFQRCAPESEVGSRPFGCVNPTGYLMIIKDPVPAKLPLTGGTNWAPLLGAAGGIVLIGALGGTLWWRRRQGVQLAGAATGGDYRSIRESSQTRGERHSA